METEIRIQVPEGMEIDRKNSTFECIKFKPKKITYRDVIKHLSYSYPIFTSNAKHKSKCVTFRKLLEVADYLNGNWKPDWNDANQNKYFISYNKDKKIYVEGCYYTNQNLVYFSSYENAEKAIDIIGEEELKQFYL